MSDDAFAADPGPAVHDPVDLPLDFEAHFLVHQKTYRRFAAEVLGDHRAGNEIALQAFSYMAANWQELLTGADPQRDADDVLAGAVMYEIHRLARERLLALRLTEARRWLGEVRDALDRIDGGCGFYEAIAALQDRQCEVYLLREIMGYTANFTAVVLGIHPRTVDYHFRRANEALTADLTDRHLLHPHIPGPRREGGHR